jgi:hypothetical protein
LTAQTLTIGVGAKILVQGDGTTTISCDGSIDIQGTLHLQNNAILRLKGNFIKNGTPATFNEGNSTVIFEGSGPFEISGGSIANKTTFSFYNLQLNLDAQNATLSIDPTNINTYVTIVNILNPIQGKLITNDALNLNDRSTSPLYARIASGNGLIEGGVRIEKRFANTKSNYRQMALPIIIDTPLANPNWNSFTTGITALLNGSTPANQNNVFIWDSRDADGASGNDYAKGWRKATLRDNGDSAFNIYLNKSNGVHLFGQGTGSDASEFNVFGELKQGDFLHNLDYTRDPADNPPTSGTDPNSKGWNLIPNPWAALIDVRKLLIDNTNFSSGYKAIHVWDASVPLDNSGVYRAILLNGVSQRTYNTSGTSLDTTVNISPFQAFWVKATDEAQVCNLISAEVQVTRNTNDNFLKKNYDLFRLNAFDQDSLTDQLVIYLTEEGTRNFDLNADGYYLASQNAVPPKFFAMEGNAKASIVGRQATTTTDSVDVVFKSTKNQSKFYINADLRELPVDWHVYLKDKKDGKTRELSNGMNLSFEHSVTNDPNRFEVYFTKMPETFTNLLDQKENEVFAFIRNGNVVLQSVGLSGLADVQVFDAVGRLLQKQTVQINLGEEKALEIHSTNQLIMIQVILNGEVFIQKMYF